VPAQQEPAKAPALDFLSKAPAASPSTPSPVFPSLAQAPSGPAQPSTTAPSNPPSKSPFLFSPTQSSTTTAVETPSSPNKPAVAIDLNKAATPPSVTGLSSPGSFSTSTSQMSLPGFSGSQSTTASAGTKAADAAPGVPSLQLTPPVPSFNFSNKGSSTPSQTASCQPPAPTSSTAQSSSPFSFPASPAPQPTSSLGSEPASRPASQPSPLSAPPRDLWADFTKWFVKGDDGLLEQFEIFLVQDLVTSTFEQFETEREERILREEMEYNNRLADDFRFNILAVRYFYRWKDNARERRLRELRRSGREQLRAYQEAQWAAKHEAQQKAARQAAKEKEQLEKLDRIKELRGVLDNQSMSMSMSMSKRKTEKALLASGVLSGVVNEKEAIAAIVGKMSETSQAGRSSSSSRQPSPTPSERRKEGAKLRALREMFEPTVSRAFRRSLPAMASESTSRDRSPVSRASERWKLKAMGIIQRPDGTAVPESLAKSQARVSSSQLEYSSSLRRASISSASGAPQQNLLTVDYSNKRKRPEEDDGDAKATDEGSDPAAHKRIMSETENTIRELRALRAELEEGTTWFKSQNDKLRGEITSRGSTPWGGSM
jgi:hypothetical protein